MRLTRKVWKNFCDVLKIVYLCKRKRVNIIIEERAVLSRIHDDIWSVVIADLERKNN